MLLIHVSIVTFVSHQFVKALLLYFKIRIFSIDHLHFAFSILFLGPQQCDIFTQLTVPFSSVMGLLLAVLRQVPPFSDGTDTLWSIFSTDCFHDKVESPWAYLKHGSNLYFSKLCSIVPQCHSCHVDLDDTVIFFALFQDGLFCFMYLSISELLKHCFLICLDFCLDEPPSFLFFIQVGLLFSFSNELKDYSIIYNIPFGNLIGIILHLKINFKEEWFLWNSESLI